MYLGIDAGSTTIKMVLCDDDGNIFNPYYSSNEGSPVEIVKKYLIDLYEKYTNINIKSSAVTGYGEELIKNALLLETNFQAELAILFIVMILLVLAIICLTIIKKSKK